jgi:hypothetical protein
MCCCLLLLQLVHGADNLAQIPPGNQAGVSSKGTTGIFFEMAAIPWKCSLAHQEEQGII